MKTLLSIGLMVFLMVGFGCKSDPKPINEKEKIEKEEDKLKEGCEWDRYISNVTSSEIQTNWQNKWEFPPEAGIENSDAIPDSFFVGRIFLEELADVDANGPCGFRVYYGLTRPGDITSMGLVITSIDKKLTDQVLGENPKIIFSNMTSVDHLHPDSIRFHFNLIPLDTAKEYTSNWRHYNNICLESTVLGNSECGTSDLERGIDPRGMLEENVAQVVYLGHAFSGLELFELVLKEQPLTSAYVFYNVMYPLTSEELKATGTGAEKGFRYDFYIKGFSVQDINGEKKGTTQPIYTYENSKEFCQHGDCCPSPPCSIDASNGCPPECDELDILQKD